MKRVPVIAGRVVLARLLLCVVAAVPLAGGCGWGGRRSGPPGDTIYLHKVGAGESLEDIAEMYYGDAGRARALAKFNDIARDDVRAGMVLRVPLRDADVRRLKARRLAQAPYNKGVKLAEQGAYVDAARKFQAALSADPEFADARYNLGVAFQQMKKHERALGQFERIKGELRDDPKYYFAVGNSYFYLKRYTDAAMAFENVIARAASHKKAQYSLAVCYEKLGERDKARAAWQRYLELDPDSAWAVEARRRLESLE